MCYICNCLEGFADFLHSIFLYCVTMGLFFLICLGFSVPIIAGILYGYNYSIAEFVSTTKSDVTVFIRRGEVYDSKDMQGYEEDYRRSNQRGPSVIKHNITAYRRKQNETIRERQPLVETLRKEIDTRKYAERLAKFSRTPTTRRFSDDVQEVPKISVSYFRFTTPPIHGMSINPNPLIQTTLLESGSSSIVMRKFIPNKGITTVKARRDPDEYFYKVNDLEDRDKIKSKMKSHKTVSEESFDDEENENMHEYSTRRTIPIRYLDVSSSHSDEEMMSYRPVKTRIWS